MDTPDKYTVTSKNYAIRWKAIEQEVPVSRKHLELPKETVELLKSLKKPSTRLELIVYCRVLVDNGWTLQSIANALSLSRERIRQYVSSEDSDLFEVVEGLAIPAIPTVKEQVYVRYIIEPDPQVLKRLLELKPLAELVRSSSPRYRQEAEEYTKLIAKEIEKGVSAKHIARCLGVTHAAINFRLTRYGYKAIGEGKTKAWKAIDPNNRPKEA